MPVDCQFVARPRRVSLARSIMGMRILQLLACLCCLALSLVSVAESFTASKQYSTAAGVGVAFNPQYHRRNHVSVSSMAIKYLWSGRTNRNRQQDTSKLCMSAFEGGEVLLNVALDKPLPIDLFGIAPIQSSHSVGLVEKLSLACNSIIFLMKAMALKLNNAVALRIITRVILVFGVALLYQLFFNASSSRSTANNNPEKRFSIPKWFQSLEEKALYGYEGLRQQWQRLFVAMRLPATATTEYKDSSFPTTTPSALTDPMPFHHVDGWGVCTLKSIQPFGRKNRNKAQSSFYLYTFALPKPNYVLPLALGQTIAICGLDRDDKPVQAEFFPFSLDGRRRPGIFSILVPDSSAAAAAEASLDGSTVGDFSQWNDRRQASVAYSLRHDMLEGDEIAIQPGGQRLEYRGLYTPVSRMLYLCVGTGIAPVLDQLRTVLPAMVQEETTTAVKDVSVVWINKNLGDFEDDITNVLEHDFYEPYSEKLTVACVLLDEENEDESASETSWELYRNEEIRDVVAPFRPGTMAVLSGPSNAMKQAVAYLQEAKGYPRDCICVM